MLNDDSSMTKKKDLDNINMELERLGISSWRFHTSHKVRSGCLDFLQPVNDRIEEFSNIDSLITVRVKEWQQMHKDQNGNWEIGNTAKTQRDRKMLFISLHLR